MKITAIDFETANSKPASICAVGAAVMEEGCIEQSFYTLIKPEANVNRFYSGNVAIHHITPGDVEDAPEFADIYRDLTDLFDDAIICAHNAAFDIGCLKAACLNTGKPVPYLRYFDTLDLSRIMYPELRHHRLNDMCDYLDIELDHHNAQSDAYGCLMIVARVMEKTGIYDIEELLETLYVRVKQL